MESRCLRAIQEHDRKEAGMRIRGMCGLANGSRAGYYRFLTTPQAGDTDMGVSWLDCCASFPCTRSGVASAGSWRSSLGTR